MLTWSVLSVDAQLGAGSSWALPCHPFLLLALSAGLWLVPFPGDTPGPVLLLPFPLLISQQFSSCDYDKPEGALLCSPATAVPQ